MASRSNKTTFAKLSRENKLRERRIEKQARKDARKLAAAHEADRTEDDAQPASEPVPDATAAVD